MILETIFNQLFENQKYFNTVYPHLHIKLFPNRDHQDIFRKISMYVEKYSKRPEAKDLRLLFGTDQNITEERTNEIYDVISEIVKVETSDNIDLLVDETERWVQDRSMEIAILESMEILEKDEPRGMIEQKVKDALSVSFKQELGMEYYLSAPDQFKYYTSQDELFKCDIELLNESMGGGARRKALYMFIGGVNVGKTLWMCHLAGSYLRNGHNVVYLTAEMSENAIYKRIDANILDMKMDDLAIGMSKAGYYGRVKQHAKKPNQGRVFVKEYPTGFGNRNHILAYLQDLQLKKAFKPDIMILDYLNIFASSRLPASQASDSYHYMKAVAEEFRAIAVEHNIAVISPTQLNRDSFKKSADSLDMTGQSDCIDINSTVIEKDKGKIKIKNLEIGQQILGVDENNKDKFVDVTKVFNVIKKKRYKIKTKSGKEIICSGDHKFPTERGLISIKEGLTIGEKLKTL